MPSLFVIQGRDQGKRFALDDPTVTLGRDASNSVQLHDTEVSRRHAEIHREGKAYRLIDLKSSNGTFVNSLETQSLELKTGDRVQIGRTLMLFTGAEDTSSAPDIFAGVDIVNQIHQHDGSRIIKSIGQQESTQYLASNADDSDSSWLSHARSNLQIMYRTALATSHTSDIDQLLHRIMELIFDWVAVDRGVIMLVDEETSELLPRVRRNRQGVRSDDRMMISRTILDYVMGHNEGVLTTNAREDDRWDAGGSIVRLGVREAICVPLQGRYGVVGVIYIDTYTPPGKILQNRVNKRFSEEHLKMMVAIGHQAALAVEDTTYYSAMVQAERLAAIGQTIATLSHHIKNILQGIRGGSFLIEEGLKDNAPDVVGKGWAIVDKNQEKISNLVMDMLSFSKEREPEMVLASLNEVTSDVIELMQSRADECGVMLEWHPMEKIPDLLFDADLLPRAILNILTNAIDASEEEDKPLVKVSTAFDSAEMKIAIVVEDNGPGIPAGDLKEIFTIFKSQKGARGTGLGLPVSQKIMREHNGDVRVDSTIGMGSRFYLEMPAVLAGVAVEKPSAADTLPDS